MKLIKFLFLTVCVVCFSTGVYAKGYPDKPVKVVVPFTAGSATDVIARIVTEKLAEMWKQPVEVENIAGAGGSTGAGVVAKATPDGYTLLVHSNSYAVNLAAYASLPYSAKDFAEIAPFGGQPYTLIANPAAGVKTISDLIALAKSKPGEIKFGSAGTGSSTHLVAERFKSAAGIDVVHVPFKGGPEANNATATGEVTYWMPPSAIALKGVKEGKVLALGVSGTTRFNLLPDVPTIAESGIKGFAAMGWWGLWAPANTPASVKKKLVKDVAQALASPDVREKLLSKGFDPMTMKPKEFAKLVQKEYEMAKQTLKAIGIQPK